jgi:hypothetical protein
MDDLHEAAAITPLRFGFEVFLMILRVVSQSELGATRPTPVSCYCVTEPPSLHNARALFPVWREPVFYCSAWIRAWSQRQYGAGPDDSEQPYAVSHGLKHHLPPLAGYQWRLRLPEGNDWAYPTGMGFRLC